MKDLKKIGSEFDEVELLKHEFLGALSAINKGLDSLRTAVVDLLDAGVDRSEMLTWAEEAGYSQSYVRTLVSQVLITAGQRQRKPGAGSRTSQEALSMAESAVDLYGDKAAKVLLAAYRALVAGKVPVSGKKLRHTPHGNGVRA